MELYLIFLVLWMAVTVPLASYKRRSVGNWAGLTFLFGVFSVALLLIMPRLPDRNERIRIRYIRVPRRHGGKVA
jgi:hypothetical protein